ncbi:MAG TPA: aminoglycoside phosphotransferase family protein [Lachnospiraceae bacterium]|nr:aminoglycoside phosphotransferase family protein [Lachnospiraceae bacterium]
MGDEIKSESVKPLDPGLLREMLSQGNTAEIYLYDQDKILKLFREKMPYEAIRYEYHAAEVLQDKLNNVPKVYDLLTYQNRYGIVYERIKGIDLLTILTKEMGKMNYYSKKMGQIHAIIHEVDIDVHYSVKDKLRNNIDEENELTTIEKEKVKQYLMTLPNGNKTCHFDFHPGNIMMQDDKPIVIDWMTACTGSESADVARTCLMLKYGEIQHASFIVKLVVHFFENRIGKVYYKEYKRITGISDKEVEQWMLPVAAARLTEWISDHEKTKLLKFVREKLKLMG